MKPTVTIEYCPKCGWMLKAAYMAQEILTTFTDDVHSVLIQPSEINGRFNIRIDDVKYLTEKKPDGFLRLKN